jgi:hypothetical protein
MTGLLMVTFLAIGVVVGADETPIPPEANWTPTPPARQMVDATQLLELLARKGVLTPMDVSELTRSGGARPTAKPVDVDQEGRMEHATAPER